MNIWDKGDIIFQPDVSNYPFKNNYKYRLLFNANWLRAVKNEVYKSAVKILGNNMELRVCTTDDYTYTIIIHQIANTIKKLNVFGVYYLSATANSLQKNKFKNKGGNDGIFDSLFLIQLTFNVTKNTREGKENALFIYKTFIHLISKYINSTNEKNKQYFKTIQKQFLSSHYYTEKQKKDLFLLSIE